ncbi:MAG: alanine racemase, partial [Pseudomonadota bacterium]
MATAPRLSIDLSALCENWQKLAIKSGTAKTSAVVKANGYGLGIEPVVEALSMNGCDTFFVATVDEGIRTRLILPNAKIFVLNGIFPETLAETLSNKLIPVLCSIEQIQLWAKNAPGTPSAIHVDTGMTRSGLTLAEAETLAKDTELLRATGGFMVMSHLACGDEPADPLNETQLARFQSIADQFLGFQKSFANSAGIVLGSGYHVDLTRPGISIYGGEATNDVPNPSKQVVKAEARILQIRDAKAGDTVGY